jgi:hypothetical protein
MKALDKCDRHLWANPGNSDHDEYQLAWDRRLQATIVLLMAGMWLAGEPGVALLPLAVLIVVFVAAAVPLVALTALVIVSDLLDWRTA